MCFSLPSSLSPLPFRVRNPRVHADGGYCFAKQPAEAFIPPIVQTSVPAGVTTTISIDTIYTLAYSTSATVVVQETYPATTSIPVTTTITSTSTSIQTVTLASGDVISTGGS